MKGFVVESLAGIPGRIENRQGNPQAYRFLGVSRMGIDHRNAE
jgi:hypothetical protein